MGKAVSTAVHEQHIAKDKYCLVLDCGHKAYVLMGQSFDHKISRVTSVSARTAQAKVNEALCANCTSEGSSFLQVQKAVDKYNLDHEPRCVNPHAYVRTYLTHEEESQ